MKHIIACRGGSGSTWLIDELKQTGLNVHKRPDVFVLKHYIPPLRKSESKHRRQRARDYNVHPLPSTCKLMSKRAGAFTFSPSKTMDWNLCTYLQRLRIRPKTTVVLAYAPTFMFLSRNKIKDCICIIRHPLHEYLSYTSPKRHGEFADAFGGQKAEMAIEWFCSEWCTWVEDFIRSENIIIRYDHAKEDADKIPDPTIRNVVSKFRKGNEHWGVLPRELEDTLHSMVSEDFYKIFSVWR